MAFYCLIDSQIKFTTKPFDAKDSFLLCWHTKKARIIMKTASYKTDGYIRLWVCTPNFVLFENSCQAITIKFLVQTIIPRRTWHSPPKASRKIGTGLWTLDSKLLTVDFRPNDRNMPTQHLATSLGATCCVSLAALLRRVGCPWFKFENGQIWANNTQHVVTRWLNACNMLRPTILRYFASACYNRLART